MASGLLNMKPSQELFPIRKVFPHLIFHITCFHLYFCAFDSFIKFQFLHLYRNSSINE